MQSVFFNEEIYHIFRFNFENHHSVGMRESGKGEAEKKVTIDHGPIQDQSRMRESSERRNQKGRGKGRSPRPDPPLLHLVEERVPHTSM